MRVRFLFTLILIAVFGRNSAAAPPFSRTDSRYADPASCVECHEEACTDWAGSDHRRSMDHATSETVLGDFSGVRFVHIGFDDLLDFDDATLKILVDDIYRNEKLPWPMREYGHGDRSANASHEGLNPVVYDKPGRKFKPPLNPRFEDFALACFDAEPGVAGKLRRVMSEEQRKEFDGETEYRKLLRVNRSVEIAGAQSRIVNHVRKLSVEKRIPADVLPDQCTTFRMFHEDGKFKAETDLGVYEVLFTLGLRPLQQYLVETENGRLQCLPVAWDSVDRHWFHLYPKEQIPVNDPLHWSKPLQNWNYMCADCHTTEFDKNFDTKTLSYGSTFAERNVGCQACHGPCGKHVETAKKHALVERWKDGVPLEVDRLSGRDGLEIVGSCASCHTRRRILRRGAKPPLEPCLDYFVTETADRPIYYPDGQLLEEAFEVGAFMQSKMYAKGVGCTNCHEPHSLKLKFEGNRLCAQCHAPGIYDTVKHHFHPDASKPGTQCVECHLPQSTYMVGDPRRDHGIRKPSPELTMKISVPNSCTLCHRDREKGETLQWAHEHVERWYAGSRASQVGYSRHAAISGHYALAIEAGRRNDPGALPLLAKVVKNRTQKDHRDFIRASALALFGRIAAPDRSTLVFESLEDPDPLVRLAAVEAFSRQPPDVKLKYLPEKLADPLLAVRLEAARGLADVADELKSDAQQKSFDAAGREYVASCAAVNDRAASYLNHAVFEHDLQASKRRQVDAWFEATVRDLQRQGGANARASFEEAVKIRNEYLRRLTEKPLDLYRQSLRVDPEFLPSRINLAMLYNERGETKEAEKQFRETLRIDPRQGDAAYSLGLLLAESDRPDEADAMLKKAAELRPENARVRYNRGLLLMRLEKRDEARGELETALKIEPQNISFLYALLVLHLQGGDRAESLRAVDRLIEIEPDNPEWKTFRRRAETLPE